MPWRRMFPPFIVHFLVSLAADSLGLIPHGSHAPLALGAVLWATAGISSLLLQLPTGQL